MNTYQRVRCLVSVFMLLFMSVNLANADSVSAKVKGSAGSVLLVKEYASFNEPWAMTFLPDRRLLITEKSGNLFLVSADGASRISVTGVPRVAYGGQGGLGDVVLHPHYKTNHRIYLSYAEEGENGTRGAAVVMASLETSQGRAELRNATVIWRQEPKVKGYGHYSHRLAFSADGKLFITSGERQKQKPAQDLTQNLGKIIRINDDGTVPADNPIQDQGELAKTFWSLGHRNMLGIAFDQSDRLWTHEMGPKHGDEFNLIKAGDNYGWPVVSWGNQYSGVDIPDHNTRPDFHAPAVYWVPTVAPAGLIIYSGSLFPEWKGDAFLGGLASRSLVRIEISGDKAWEAERFAMGKRIREVEQGPDGAIWVLEDKKGGRLLKLTKDR
ncbi:PQQ-dependent sugar dehydrogenase [Desulfopila sp. IMCC35008]|uniref:PQQ-dependent sugar dehydrogenase n=1 Tax=Desulfopila sp. IMCC35008 TaxID=2653858 RepID=UPI0013D703EA|nr:PQQ-dependent sugar dehydrogenase [Desulfopila sp. IMCC35008]